MSHTTRRGYCSNTSSIYNRVTEKTYIRSNSCEDIEESTVIFENNHSDFKLNGNNNLMMEAVWTLNPEKLNFIQQPEDFYWQHIQKKQWNIPTVVSCYKILKRKIIYWSTHVVTKLVCLKFLMGIFEVHVTVTWWNRHQNN